MTAAASVKNDEHGQLLIAGLHDSSLRSLEFTEHGRIELRFTSIHGGTVIVFVEAVVFVWSGGCIFPNVVGRMSIENRPMQSSLERYLKPSVVKSTLDEAGLMGELDWVIILEFSVGESILFFGIGEPQVSASFLH